MTRHLAGHSARFCYLDESHVSRYLMFHRSLYFYSQKGPIILETESLLWKCKSEVTMSCYKATDTYRHSNVFSVAQISLADDQESVSSKAEDTSLSFV